VAFEKKEIIMKERQLTLPTIMLIAGTRVALGVGLGLLLADRLTAEQRRSAGWALLAVGALTTIPLAAEVLGGTPSSDVGSLHVRQTGISPYVTAS
jgi:hypothetical protein